MIALIFDPGKVNFAWSLVAGTPATKNDDPAVAPDVGVLATGLFPVILKALPEEVLLFRERMWSFVEFYRPDVVVVERFHARTGGGPAGQASLIEPINLMIGQTLVPGFESLWTTASVWKRWMDKYVNEWGEHKVAVYDDGSNSQQRAKRKKGPRRKAVHHEPGVCVYLDTEHEACASVIGLWALTRLSPYWKNTNAGKNWYMNDWRADAAQRARWLT